VIFDLISGQQADASGGGWTPDELFVSANGDRGFWFDGSNFARMFQDAAGTIPVTSLGQPVALWVTMQPEFNVSMALADRAPITVSNSGKLALRYDSVNDQLLMPGSVVVDVSRGATLAMGMRRTVSQDITSLLAANTPADTYFQLRATGNGISATVSGAYENFPTLETPNNQANTIIAWSKPDPSSVPTTCRVNGVQQVGTIVPTAVSATVRAYACSTTTVNIDIAQAFYINRTLTTEEITLLENFIVGKS